MKNKITIISSFLIQTTFSSIQQYETTYQFYVICISDEIRACRKREEDTER